jgi:hypothetical protein
VRYVRTDKGVVREVVRPVRSRAHDDRDLLRLDSVDDAPFILGASLYSIGPIDVLDYAALDVIREPEQVRSYPDPIIGPRAFV